MINSIHSPRPRIRITQESIDRAVRKDSNACVIADALSTQVPGASNVSVDLQSVRYTNREEGIRYVWLTPSKAQQLLIAFDQGWPIEPQEIRFGGAAQIIEVQAASRSQAKTSATRRAELEAKEEAGEEMTPGERRSLSRFRSNAARMGGARIEDRAMAPGKPALVPVGDASKKHVTVGGTAPPMAVLAHGRGRRRSYGVKVAGRTDHELQESAATED